MTWTLTGSGAIEPVASRKDQYSTRHWALLREWGMGHGAFPLRRDARSDRAPPLPYLTPNP
ncbi:MAG: hypothetical protein MUC60_13985 [Oscillatoria sp. Prado101]|jgi:hypothetical protein|nr:hypothetical protein [Oscillatoria sp. Prado101]